MVENILSYQFCSIIRNDEVAALYHMARGRAPISRVPSLRPVLEAAELERLPICRVAVLVGTALDPSRSKNPTNLKGSRVNTLWGEMAYQLATDAGDPRLYDYVKDADMRGVSPGSEALKNLFDACGPCIILIDELVAYAKKLWRAEKLPAGTFDNLISFIQEITEAARASENSLVVASIPESNVEIGEGEGGRKALEAIEHTFGRMESIWKPVAANEGFEIVRRRLFLSCKDEPARDAVCTAFSQLYQGNGSDFPTEAKEVDYMLRMRSCYPIHPEVFDRLYNDWATIEHFQKTRGVLRLMAAVVYNLWINNDGGLMILPGSISLAVPGIRDELTRHVSDQWNAIVDHEVDGENSVPFLKDKENTSFGRVMAARRVARTIMLGSAPSSRADSIRGLEVSRIRLGTVQPGEQIPVFNDALFKLQTSLSYLYNNPSADRFWYDTRPTLRKTAEDRASQRSMEEVEMEIERRLKGIRKEPPFARLHICPNGSSDVSDDQDIGLVILRHNQAFKKNEPTDRAIIVADKILNTRGSAPRIYRNMLAFIAPDASTVYTLQDAVRHFLAWRSIKEDSVDLNLDAAQNRETDNNLTRCNRTVEDRIRETYCHLLVPYIDREVDLRAIIWDNQNIRGGSDSIVAKAAKKLRDNEQLITKWAPGLLSMQLDNLLWQGRNELSVGELWKQLCTYCYLPRLASFDVLAESIRSGVNEEAYFAYAEGMDGNGYRGLKYKQYVGLVDRSGYLVTPSAAQKQLETPPAVTPPVDPPVDLPVDPPSRLEEPTNTHFSMNVTLNNTRVVKNVSDLMDEIINHLMSLEGSRVDIRLFVDADIPEGTPQGTVRTVMENCRTMHIDDCGFDH